MTRWRVSGRDAGGERAFAFERTDLVAEAGNHNDLPFDGPHIRLGDTSPQSLPCEVLPTSGNHLAGWQQDKPADLVSPWVRLWIAGFLALHSDWDGVVCACHGDVTHWIHISAGEAVSMQSALTLRLAHVLGTFDDPDSDAISDTLSRPEKLASHLRVAEVSGNNGAITGHLIGAELASTKAYWLGQQVLVIAEHPSIYASALTAQSVHVIECHPRDLELLGFVAIAKSLGILSDAI